MESGVCGEVLRSFEERGRCDYLNERGRLEVGADAGAEPGISLRRSLRGHSFDIHPLENAPLSRRKHRYIRIPPYAIILQCFFKAMRTIFLYDNTETILHYLK